MPGSALAVPVQALCKTGLFANAFSEPGIDPNHKKAPLDRERG